MHCTALRNVVVIALRHTANGRQPSPEDRRKGMSKMEQIVVCHGCDVGILSRGFDSWIHCRQDLR